MFYFLAWRENTLSHAVVLISPTQLSIVERHRKIRMATWNGTTTPPCGTTWIFQMQIDFGLQRINVSDDDLCDDLCDDSGLFKQLHHHFVLLSTSKWGQQHRRGSRLIPSQTGWTLAPPGGFDSAAHSKLSGQHQDSPMFRPWTTIRRTGTCPETFSLLLRIQTVNFSSTTLSYNRTRQMRSVPV